MPASPSHPSPTESHARDLELAALYQGGATLQEIGDAVSLSRERVRQRIVRLGLTIQRLDGEHVTRALVRYHARQQLSINQRRIVQALGLPRRSSVPLVERRRRRAQVEAIVRRLARTLGRAPTYREVGEALFGVPRHDPASGSRLVNYVSRQSFRRPTRLLHAIWRRCGLAVHKPGRRPCD